MATAEEHKHEWINNPGPWYGVTKRLYDAPLMLAIEYIALDFLKRIKFKSLLEVGCCWGHHLMNIATNFPDKKFLGVDISEWYINAAKDERKKRDIHNVGFIVKDAEDMIFGDKFDVVMAGDFFTGYPKKAAREAFDKMVEYSNKYILLTHEFTPDYAIEREKDWYNANDGLYIHDFDTWFKENNLELRKTNLHNFGCFHERFNIMLTGEKID